MADWEVVSQTPIETAAQAPQAGGWEVVDQKPIAAPGEDISPSTMGGNIKPGDLKQMAEDYMTQIANAATFGLAAKAKAGIHSALGEGSYDELLKKYRQQNEEAGKRIGTTGQIAAGLAGGGALASGLGRMGVTAVGNLSPEAGIIARTLAGGAEGAGYGAAYGAGNTDTGNLEDYVKNAIAGGKMGALVGAAIPATLSVGARAITPAPIQSAERARLGNILAQEGVPLSAGDRTGSGVLRTLEDVTAKLPFGTALGNPRAGQMEAVTQAAAQRAGLPAGEITGDVLKQGQQAVGGRIANIQKQYPIAVDQPFLNDVLEVANGIPFLAKDRQGAVKTFLNRLVNNQGEIDPAMASATRSQLRRSINAHNGPNGDKEYQTALIDIRDALDNALTRTIQAGGNPAHVAELQQARQQYANLQVLQDALHRSGGGTTLTPAALKSAQTSSLGKNAYMQGRGDLTDLAKGSSQLLRPVPDSFTATREGMLNPFKWAAGGAGQLALTNPIMQRYWGNQLLPAGVANEVAPPVIGGLLADQQRRRGLLSP